MHHLATYGSLAEVFADGGLSKCIRKGVGGLKKGVLYEGRGVGGLYER